MALNYLIKSFRIEKELFDLITELAEAFGNSKAHIVRQILELNMPALKAQRQESGSFKKFHKESFKKLLGNRE